MVIIIIVIFILVIHIVIIAVFVIIAIIFIDSFSSSPNSLCLEINRDSIWPRNNVGFIFLVRNDHLPLTSVKGSARDSMEKLHWHVTNTKINQSIYEEGI